MMGRVAWRVNKATFDGILMQSIRDAECEVEGLSILYGITDVTCCDWSIGTKNTGTKATVAQATP